MISHSSLVRALLHYGTVQSVTIDHDSHIPVYMQLAQILRDKIISGEIENRLPSIRTLIQEYGVSQASVVHALVVLEEDDRVFPVTGKGYYVKRG
jgi:DNA-binding GntR family transcriptional regulator